VDCRRFRADLAAYLAGRLAPLDFDAMAAHEAECAACAERAAEEMDGIEDRAAARETFTDEWMREVLGRTAGRDCRAVQRLLAERLDGPFEPPLARVVEDHARACPACARVAGGMDALPALYAGLPRLGAGRKFTQAVVSRTSRTAPGFVETLAAMLRRPALVWEGALICALLTTPWLGRPMQRLTESVQEGPLTVQAEIAREAWVSFDARLTETHARLAGLASPPAVREPWTALRRVVARRASAAVGPGTRVGGWIAAARIWLRFLVHTETIDRPAESGRPSGPTLRDETGVTAGGARIEDESERRAAGLEPPAASFAGEDSTGDRPGNLEGFPRDLP